MKISIIAVLVMAASSFAAQAQTMAQASEAVSHASRMLDAAQARVDAAANAYGTGSVQDGLMHQDKQQLNVLRLRQP